MSLGPLETEVRSAERGDPLRGTSLALVLEYARLRAKGKALIHASVITFRPAAEIAWKTKAFAPIGERTGNVLSKAGRPI